MLLKETVHVEYIVAHREVEEDGEVEVLIAEVIGQTTCEVRPCVAHNLTVCHSNLSIFIHIVIDCITRLGINVELLVKPE